MPSDMMDIYYSVFHACTFSAVEDLSDLLDGMPAGYRPIIKASIFLIPVSVMAVFGRNRLFGFVTRRIDKDPARLQYGGAFMASLLDGISAHKGDVWWIHHGRNYADFAEFDPLKNWQEGVVVKVTTEEILVSTSPTSQPGGRISVSSSRSFTSDSSAEVVCQSVPNPARELTAERLLRLARECLRCIDWEKIDEGLMTGAICDPNASDIAGYYQLSRPVHHGEIIDFFLSHSWHDNAKMKWKCLEGFVAEFIKATSHPPTFWLDKACIDQSKIADGLRALPVNVLACAQVLVLCGHTYPTRLWCVWELFTLMTVTEEQLGFERMIVIPFGNADDAVVECLKCFEMSMARCYNPNEEGKLKSVITAVGEARFNSMIRKIACNVEQQLAGEVAKKRSRKMQFHTCPRQSPHSMPTACIGAAHTLDIEEEEKEELDSCSTDLKELAIRSSSSRVIESEGVETSADTSALPSTSIREGVRSSS